MAQWGFECYIDARGHDLIRTWHDEELSEDGQAVFLARLIILAGTPRAEWERPEYAPLRDRGKEKGKGLGEIRFTADKKEQRPLGFHIPDEKVFVIVNPVIEKGSRFIPASAVEVAQKRKAEVLKDRKRAREIWLELE